MQPQALFRQEAIDSRALKQWGEVTLLQPLPIRLLFLAIILAVALIVAFLFTAQYARKETAVGYLTPTAGIVRVFLPRAGTIQSVNIVEGQKIAKGQLLFTVSVDQTTTAGANVDIEVLDALARRSALLGDQIATQERYETLERQRLEARSGGIEGEMAQLEAQIAAQDELVRIAFGRVAAGAELLAQGLISDDTHKGRREAYLEQKRSLGALAQELEARRNQLSETRLSLEQLPVTAAEKVQLLRKEQLETKQRVAETEGRRAYAVLAPVAGRVSTLQAIAGRTTDPRQPQLSILPNDAILQAELFVPARASGFVRVGQEVRILYDAFPYQRFGTYRGWVITISQTVLTGSDISAPVALQEPAYRVIVALDRQDIAGNGGSTPLQADMLLRADIVLERRALIAWLLDPLLRVRIS